ncbi:MAG: hypothetical protein ACUVR2_02840 [Anaerolineae bacterium]
MDALSWLLEPDNPSVRYLALRHLLGHSKDDMEVQAARSAIPSSPLVARIFARQAPGGYWGDPTSPYLPKYKSTYWTLMLLGHLGLHRTDEPVQRAAEHIFRFQQPEGGFAECSEEGAWREYSYVTQRRQAHGKQPPEPQAFMADLVHQMTLSCLTGNMVATLLRLGYDEDPRLWRAVGWLVSIQHGDGGWLCPYWKAHIRDKHSCFHGTICALEGLAEIPLQKRSPQVQESLARGAEFLLMHRLYRSDHHDWQVINPSWLEFAFPWFSGYSVLRGLWVLTRLGINDERMEDGLTVLREKQRNDGKWILEKAPSPMQVTLEKKGQPSKWITLKALGVLQSA